MIDSNRTLRFNRTMKECGWDSSPIHDPDASRDGLIVWMIWCGVAAVIIVNLVWIA